MASNLGPIAVNASKTRRHLQELCLDITNRTQSDGVPEGVDVDAQYLTDCLGRFNIWVGSLGVFQNGEASLDFRISTGDLAQEVLRLLDQLDFYTSELKTLVDGSREQRTWTGESLYISRDEFSDSEDISDDDTDGILTPESDQNEGDDDIITESRDLHLSINESITSLLRLSVQLHKSSRKAKFAKSSVDNDYSIEHDVSHVRDFFPYASGNGILVERLGKANAQRRQWLWYRRHHREKLSVDLSGPQEERIPWFRATERSNIGSIAMLSVDDRPSASLPSLSGTNATTFRSRVSASLDITSQSDAPDTVFERSSRATLDEEKLLVPEPPKDLIPGEPFQCRYCCNIIELHSRHAWQKHVHVDLSSYTCFFGNCSEMFFESRHKWWAHEMEVHRKKWICAICGIEQPTIVAIKAHLQAKHSGQVSLDQVDDIAHRFGRPLTHIPASDCPLCDYPAVLRRRGYSDEDAELLTTDKFGRHLGRHLEQLALFVLPNADLLYEEDHVSDTGSHDHQGESDSDEGEGESSVPLLSEPDLVQKLFDEVALQHSAPEILPTPPDLAMRWQPPHDFTPPEEDFDTEDADLLPVRQEPIFGGDLHTPGWARGMGSRKEGFCARCPVSHWVNIPDGSYQFHLTYFHGVPDSGVPLPRPSTIRPVQGRTDMWEGFCEACDRWKVLKKTKRGWNWYRHWLLDHAGIIKDRTEALRQGNTLEEVQLQNPAESSKRIGPFASDVEEFDILGGVHPRVLSNDNLIKHHLEMLARNDLPQPLETLLAQLKAARNDKEVRALVNTTSKTGESLLMISASQGQDRVVGLLLGFGADPNALGPDGQTALDCATDAGYFTIVQQLVSGGADPSKSHVFKRVFSNEREYAGEMTKTVEHSVQPLSRIDPAQLGALSRAAFEGDIGSARRLLGGYNAGPSSCDVEDGAEAGYTAFLLASMANHLQVMELLLEHGANINATSKHGWTALMLAARRNDEESVAFLLSHGADVNHVSPDQWTALAEATSRGYTHIMEVLLNAGADPESRSHHDWTPLMHAAYQGDIVAINLLLDAGASFDGISNRDETVMLLGAAKGSKAVVKRLLDAGCPPESVWSRKIQVVKADVGSVTDEAARPVAEERETEGKQQQQRIERVYKVGWTPLMVACQIGSLEIVTMLLDAGANPEPKSPMFKTALEIAKENGRVDVAEYLEKGFSQ